MWKGCRREGRVDFGGGEGQGKVRRMRLIHITILC